MNTEKISDLIKSYRRRTKITFPKVKRVFPTLIAHDIVSVQPMALPSGLIFYLDYSYNKKDEQK